MNKKIYFNDKFIEVAEVSAQTSQDQSINNLNEFKVNTDSLKKLRNDFLKSTNEDHIMITVRSFKEFFKDFKKLFHYIEAAGGFIQKDDRYLFIHRHGRWDLPKGKLEKKETIERAAVRECEEECGVKNLMIQRQLNSTYHLYAYKGDFAIKETYWFYMTTNFPGDLVPQEEESIDQVKWFNRDEIAQTVISDTYYTISDVVKESLDI